MISKPGADMKTKVLRLVAVSLAIGVVAVGLGRAAPDDKARVVAATRDGRTAFTEHGGCGRRGRLLLGCAGSVSARQRRDRRDLRLCRRPAGRRQIRPGERRRHRPRGVGAGHL